MLLMKALKQKTCISSWYSFVASKERFSTTFSPFASVPHYCLISSAVKSLSSNVTVDYSAWDNERHYAYPPEGPS